MTKESIIDELKKRINWEIDYYDGNLPKDVVLAWDGYLAGILEWNVIDLDDFTSLTRMLPKIPINPVYSIATGIPGDHLKQE